MLTLPLSSTLGALVGFQAPAARCVAPRAALRLSGAAYPEYIKERQIKEIQEGAPPAETFGASAGLVCDPTMVSAAKEAAEGAGINKFSGSDIVVAFNSFKLSVGRGFNNADAEALELRAFAANEGLIAQYLESAESALFMADMEGIDLMPAERGVDWRGVYNQAAEVRAAAESERAEAIAGRLAATDKMRQAQLVASRAEDQALGVAQAEYQRSLADADEAAARERARLAQQLAQVAVTERDARAAAERRLESASSDARKSTATVLVAAESDQKGALHKWQMTEAKAVELIQAAEAEMKEALVKAEEQEKLQKQATEKRASAALAAQSEAKALLEMLKQTQEKAAMDVARAEQEKKDMLAKVEEAKKKAQKYKAAAAAALEEI